MKKITIIFLILFSIINSIIAQVPPQAISYQAIVRNSNGNAYGNKDVMLKVYILEESVSGNSVYSEEHSLTTDKWGLVSLEIGLGTPITGTFDAINWGSSSFFCKIEIDLMNGQGYELTGISQFISVPYALYSERAETVEYVDFNQIINVPVFFSGDYNDLINTPDFTGWDTDVSDDFSGDYNDLNNSPDFTNWDTDVTDDFSGNYNDLTNTPDFTGWDTDVSDDFSGNYNDLSNAPAIDGSETIITGGTNVTVTGTGTTPDPYVINSSASGSNPVVGGEYGGGTVVYINETGYCGITAVKIDASIGQGALFGLDNITNSDGIGGGYNNTILWITKLSSYTFVNPAFGYETSQNGVSYGRWYIPCEYELRIVYENKDVLGITDGIYWSSSVKSSNEFYGIDFSTGNTVTLSGPLSDGRVCYIRRF